VTSYGKPYQQVNCQEAGIEQPSISPKTLSGHPDSINCVSSTPLPGNNRNKIAITVGFLGCIGAHHAWLRNVMS